MRDAALGYAAAGWPLVPVVARTKRPYVKTGTDHAEAATCDLAQVGAWWSRWPEAGIGLSCAAGGFLVIDVDDEEGRQTFLEHPGPFPLTTCARSGRDGPGFHLFYRIARGARVPRSRLIGPGLELRAGGSLIVLAPSLHASGAGTPGTSRRTSWQGAPTRWTPGPWPNGR